MKRWKRAAAFGLAILCSASAAFASFAVEKPEDIDDATWARLQDNRLEYDEIEQVVHYFNPTYRQIIEQFELNIQPMEDAVEELKRELRDNRNNASRAKKENDVMEYAVYDATAKFIDKQMLRPIESGLKVIRTSERTVATPVGRQLTAVIQQLMNGYNQVLASIELVDTAAELAEAAYHSTLSQKSLGMATDTDVENAEKSLLSARNQQQSLNNTMASLRQNLSIMTGLPYNTLLEIGTVPAPEPSEIESMNPEQDVAKAVVYNETIKSQRKMPGSGDANYRYKSLTMEETEAKIKIKLESLYQEILKNRTACDAAYTAFESARLVMDGNNLKYQMGMLGRLEYLQGKLAYLQAKMTYDMSVLTLKQSIEDYNWALKGVIELD